MAKADLKEQLTALEADFMPLVSTGNLTSMLQNIFFSPSVTLTPKIDCAKHF
jgi:hypothetical protein